jgi:FkbM family methyltransferase
MRIIRTIKNFLPEEIKTILNNGLHTFDTSYLRSYSQEGEDMILRNIFRNKRDGFYVDIGAHHPKFFSNTYFFYEIGWSGINVDAMPGSMNVFKQIRSRDINLEQAVSDVEQELTFYAFNPAALNTFSPELASKRKKIQKFAFLFEKKIKTHKLIDILEKHVPSDTVINFMTIDVEGLDLEVLKSNDWNRYRPEVILIESLNFDFDNRMNDPVYAFLTERGYKIFSKTVNTLFFLEKNYKLDAH